MDAFDLMWEDATRDTEAERAELARTAALADATGSLWPLLAQAEDREDLGNRLALAGEHLSVIAVRRGYPAEQLAADLVQRWSLVQEAKTAAQRSPRKKRAKKTTSKEPQAADSEGAAVAALTVRAALDNPSVPLRECQRLAAEAVRKVAEGGAVPLGYESWGRVGDGDITRRIKDFKPGGIPGPKEPGPGDRRIDGPNGQTALFPEPPRSPSRGPAAADPGRPDSGGVSDGQMALFPAPGDGPGGQIPLFPEPQRASSPAAAEPPRPAQMPPRAHQMGLFGDPDPNPFSDPPQRPEPQPGQLMLPLDPNPDFSHRASD